MRRPVRQGLAKCSHEHMRPTHADIVKACHSCDNRPLQINAISSSDIKHVFADGGLYSYGCIRTVYAYQ